MAVKRVYTLYRILAPEQKTLSLLPSQPTNPQQVHFCSFTSNYLTYLRNSHKSSLPLVSVNVWVNTDLKINRSGSTFLVEICLYHMLRNK